MTSIAIGSYWQWTFSNGDRQIWQVVPITDELCTDNNKRDIDDVVLKCFLEEYSNSNEPAYYPGKLYWYSSEALLGVAGWREIDKEEATLVLLSSL